MSKPKSRGTALVTGGAKRIGQAIVLTLAEMGYNIALHYNESQSEANKTAGLVRKKGVRCMTFSCDLDREKAVLALIKSVHEEFSDLNVLINSASIFEKSELKTAGLEAFNRHFAINLKTPFILTCEFARICKEGNIINFLDTHITQNTSEHFAYLMTKKSLADLTKMSAATLGPKIRVNGICPGIILPPPGSDQSRLKRMAERVPLKRKGDVSYMTQSVQFLLENDYLTGQFLFNDGGEHLIP